MAKSKFVRTSLEKISLRWSGPGGYRDVLNIGIPLVASMGSITLMLFTDRLFLSRYSLEAIAAAMPAGIASFLFLSFFMGVASYVNVFVAQYIGMGKPKMVGASLWQGLYFSFGSAIVLAMLFFIARPLFQAAGHTTGVQELEVKYFQILILGSGVSVCASALSGFFSGRGLTRIVMLAHFVGAAVNIPLDYCLINGIGPFPELGIKGAGIATVTAYSIIMLIFALLIFTRANDRRFGVFCNWRFSPEIFYSLMKYGLPNGIQFFIDVFAFTAFVFIVGRLGNQFLAATNIVFSISTFAFLPMIGFGIGLSVIVGQALGRDKPKDAERATASTLQITLAYMLSIALLFLLTPELLMELFRSRTNTHIGYDIIVRTGVILLRFVAFYSIFDTLFIVYSSAIKGAGDTRYAMWAIAILSLGLMVLPVYIGIIYLGAGIYYAWLCLTMYVFIAGFVFRRRYKKGKWQDMRVVEKI
ncbi:MATE family efflux transporter [Thermodesulfobacteriota bacterium]